MTYLAWLIFIVAALLEVGGDAVIRKGLALSNWTFIASGFLMLGCSAWWLRDFQRKNHASLTV